MPGPFAVLAGSTCSLLLPLLSLDPSYLVHSLCLVVSRGLRPWAGSICGLPVKAEGTPYRLRVLRRRARIGSLCRSPAPSSALSERCADGSGTGSGCCGFDIAADRVVGRVNRVRLWVPARDKPPPAPVLVRPRDVRGSASHPCAERHRFSASGRRVRCPRRPYGRRAVRSTSGLRRLRACGRASRARRRDRCCARSCAARR